MKALILAALLAVPVHAIAAQPFMTIPIRPGAGTNSYTHEPAWNPSQAQSLANAKPGAAPTTRAIVRTGNAMMNDVNQACPDRYRQIAEEVGLPGDAASQTECAAVSTIASACHTLAMDAASFSYLRKNGTTTKQQMRHNIVNTSHGGGMGYTIAINAPKSMGVVALAQKTYDVCMQGTVKLYGLKPSAYQRHSSHPTYQSHAHAMGHRDGTANVGGYTLPLYVVTPVGIYSHKKARALDRLFAFHITAEEASKLAVYDIRQEGVILAPRGMVPAPGHNAIGATGNSSAEIVKGNEFISLDNQNGSANSANESAQGRLPWVKNVARHVKYSPKPDEHFVRITKDITAISYQNRRGEQVNGVVWYRPGTGDNSQYQSCWFCAPALGHSANTEVLNFFYKYDVGKN
jgi:hypothetical protein